MTNPIVGWGLATLGIAAGYVGWGWPGVVLGITVLVFWLLLQFSRSLRVLKQAAGAPVGHVGSAVMLQSKLTAGMTLVPSDIPRSSSPAPTRATRSGSMLFWNVTSRPASS